MSAHEQMKLSERLKGRIAPNEWYELEQLEAALTLIGDVAYSRDGYYTGDAEKLGVLVYEIYGYARNPQTAVDALKESE